MATVKKSISDNRGTAHNSQAEDFIALVADQLTAAVDEAFLEIEALSHSFLATAQHANNLLDAVDHVNSGNAGSHPLHVAVRDASVHLQFADRLHQRLSNAAKNLNGFARLFHTNELPVDNAAWDTFLYQTRATFTMEEERRMFDAVFPIPATSVAAEQESADCPGSSLFDGAARDDL